MSPSSDLLILNNRDLLSIRILVGLLGASELALGFRIKHDLDSF
jgi:hypothetical protein